MSKKFLLILLIPVILIGGYLALIEPSLNGIQANLSQKDQLDTQLNQLMAEASALQSQKSQIRVDIPMPKGVVIRTFKYENLEHNLREMVGTILKIATDAGGEFISLEPGASGSAGDAMAAEETSKDDVKVGGRKNFANPGGSDGNAPAEGGEDTQVDAARQQMNYLKTYSYDLAIRGSYSNLLEFLSTLMKYQELLEVTSISISNEATMAKNAADANLNPAKPLRLTAKLKLFLVEDFPGLPEIPGLKRESSLEEL